MILVHSNCLIFGSFNEDFIEDASIVIENDRIKEITTTPPAFNDMHILTAVAVS